MIPDLFSPNPLQDAFTALRDDLVDAHGPRISTMRNYRFAILQYAPEQEYELRDQAQRLSTELVASGWKVLSIDLQKLLMDRVREEGSVWAERVASMETRLAEIDPARGLNHLRQKLSPLIEGPEGLAADCSRIIQQHAKAHPELVDRTVALVGRAGALFPFYRTSALLKHLDGKTCNIPVVLLYPGERRGKTGLSFMGVLDADDDYRPRIYP